MNIVKHSPEAGNPGWDAMVYKTLIDAHEAGELVITRVKTKLSPAGLWTHIKHSEVLKGNPVSPGQVQFVIRFVTNDVLAYYGTYELPRAKVAEMEAKGKLDRFILYQLTYEFDKEAIENN